MSFEDELQRALRRQDPPPGFANRTIRRMANPSRAAAATRSGWTRIVTPFPRSRWIAAGVAASLVIAAGGQVWMERHAAQEAQRAKHDVEMALRIVSETLNDVQTKVATATATNRRME